MILKKKKKKRKRIGGWRREKWMVNVEEEEEEEEMEEEMEDKRLIVNCLLYTFRDDNDIVPSLTHTKFHCFFDSQKGSEELGRTYQKKPSGYSALR